ncbi:peroxiredoxin [Methylobacillus caricis]|uniref:peroxiredoxin n=1 Tax=Methylobacillus caricis TaxID=1971611 RepID=UPI001D0010B8|nr:peroxiredoxin [Methylobacillus caricis]MCB5187777.1 peroxiredoxin [Methylobacillus caricis]
MLKIFAALVIMGLALIAFRFANAAAIPKTGSAAPSFTLPDAKKQNHSLADYSGQWLVLYFYPKDDTPGCTKEACSFRDDLFQLEKLGAKVVGISVDDSASHAKFAEKYSLPFPLLSDADGKVADSYGALTNLGIIKIAKRYTFLIDPKGNIAKTYLSVDTSRHSQEIIEDLKKFKQ